MSLGTKRLWTGLAVVCAGAVGWWAGRVGIPPLPPPVVMPSAGLNEERVAVNADLARLRQERSNLEQENLRSALRQAFMSLAAQETQYEGSAPPSSTAESEPPQTYPPSAQWDRLIRRTQGTSGTLSDLDVRMMAVGSALALLARQGEAGLAFLKEVATDPQRTEDERTLAFHLLGTLPDRAALEYLVGVAEQAAASENPLVNTRESLLCINNQLGHLSALASGIAPSLATRITELASNTSLDTGKGATRAWETLAWMAFTQNDAQARSLLRDSRVLDANQWGALRAAEAAHTPEARAFVERIEREHPAQQTNELAAEILGQW